VNPQFFGVVQSLKVFKISRKMSDETELAEDSPNEEDMPEK